MLFMFNENECERIGKLDAINILINICQNILKDISNYTSIHQLEIAWGKALKILKKFEANLLNIKKDLNSAIDASKFKALMQIQKRVSSLKTKIKNSEIFSKYLVHKELNRLRFRETEEDNEQFVWNTTKTISEASIEEDKIKVRKIFKNVSHLLDSESSTSKELNNMEQKHNTDIEILKQSHNITLDEIVKDPSENVDEIKWKEIENKAKKKIKQEDLFHEKIVIEQELNKIKNQCIDSNPPCISYQVYYFYD